MRRAISLFLLFFLISGCGDLAPNNATVQGPADGLESLERVVTPAANNIFYFLVFTAKNEAGDVLADIEMEFFLGGVDGIVSLTDKDRNLLPGTFLKIKTDERGIGEVGFRLTVAGCATTGTSDIKASGSILASVGSASALWKSSATRSCSTT